MKDSTRRILNCLVCALVAVTLAHAEDSATSAPGADLPEKCYANQLELSRCLATLAIQEDARLDEMLVKVRAELMDRSRKLFDDLDGMASASQL
ncbi:MAG TPA: hypothetical protein VM146_09715 [Steroidobacteraceae bacterium]|nr:hypothetical protein [Steroidobacteraceae bacterium]